MLLSVHIWICVYQYDANQLIATTKFMTNSNIRAHKTETIHPPSLPLNIELGMQYSETCL